MVYLGLKGVPCEAFLIVPVKVTEFEFVLR